MAYSTPRSLFTEVDPYNESPTLFPPLPTPPSQAPISQTPAPPPLTYQLFPPPPAPPENSPFPRQLLLIGFVIGAFLFFVVLFMTIAGYLLKRRNSRQTNRRNLRDPPILFDTREEFRFLDEERGPQLDHPIWYIRTVGLDQSDIDSIPIFRYKAGEGLIDGTNCSVCLAEFDEDETLRLLPKCSHAFHLPCIDTWLRSHKNCPLCRAPVTPIAADAGDAADSSSVEPRTESRGSGSSSETLPNLEDPETSVLTDARDIQRVVGVDELALQGMNLNRNWESRIVIVRSSRFNRSMKSCSFGSSNKKHAPLKRSSSSK